MLYDASKSVATCVLILIPPAYITLALRCGVRIHRKAWGIDDTCMIISAVRLVPLSRLAPAANASSL